MEVLRHEVLILITENKSDLINVFLTLEKIIVT